jgi:F-type H+-transporting ATPase subunit a
MLAGHTLLTIFGSFGSFIFNNFKIFYLLPILICFLITVLEFSVSIIQAYVFIVLLIIYLSDMILIKH